MTEARFVYEGKSIDYTPTENIAAGTVVVLGDIIAIASLDMKAGVLGALAIEGVFEVPKEADDEGKFIGVGTKVYWNATDKRVELSEGEPAVHKYMGKTVKAALTTDTTTWVKLGL